jgi:hypothetical protein
MASSSKSGASIHPGRGKERTPEEAWKNAPSRETTHADPQGGDAQVRKWRKKDENAPGKTGK